MGSSEAQPKGPDLAAGVAIEECPDGKMLSGRVGEDAVLLARRGDEFFAIGATCTHYNGPLAEGLLVDDTVRCHCHTPRNRATRYGSVIPSDPAMGSRPLPAAFNAHVLSR